MVKCFICLHQMKGLSVANILLYSIYSNRSLIVKTYFQSPELYSMCSSWKISLRVSADKKNRDEYEFADNFWQVCDSITYNDVAHNRFTSCNSNHREDRNVAPKTTGQKSHAQFYTILSIMPKQCFSKSNHFHLYLSVSVIDLFDLVWLSRCATS